MIFCSFQGISPIFLSLNLFLFCILSFWNNYKFNYFLILLAYCSLLVKKKIRWHQAGSEAGIRGHLKGSLGYTEDPGVSCDFNSDAHSSIFDAGLALPSMITSSSLFPAMTMNLPIATGGGPMAHMASKESEPPGPPPLATGRQASAAGESLPQNSPPTHWESPDLHSFHPRLPEEWEGLENSILSCTISQVHCTQQKWKLTTRSHCFRSFHMSFFSLIVQSHKMSELESCETLLNLDSLVSFQISSIILWCTTQESASLQALRWLLCILNFQTQCHRIKMTKKKRYG